MEDENKIPLDQWKAQFQEQCQKLLDAQDAELKKVVSSGENLMQYFAGRGRLGTQFSAGNAALILAENPKARVAMTMQQWNDFGRRINRGAKGIKVLNRKNKYESVEYVYELAQTYGERPYKMLYLVSAPLAAQNAVNALAALSPVEIVAVENAEKQVFYDKNSQTIVVPSSLSDAEVLRWLPAAIVQAYMESPGEIAEEPDLAAWYGECVSVELCGRFGLPILPQSAQRLEKQLSAFEPGEERAMLEEIHAFAKTMGDHVTQALAPLQLSKALRSPMQPRGRE